MKKLTFLLISLFAYLTVFAGEVTEQQALQIAQKFMQGKQFKQQNLRRASIAADNAFYVFNAENKGGFVIVAGDDQMPEILGYSEKGHFDLSNAPDNVKWLMDYYSEIAKSLKNGNCNHTSRRTPTNREGVSPFVKTTWNQTNPYNLHCPTINEGHTVTGCVAVAVAQVVNYFQWPKEEVAEIGGYTSFSGAVAETLPKRRFNWYNMTDDEIAWLIRYCGQAVNTQYGLDGSSAGFMLDRVLKSMFGYSPNIKGYLASSYSDEEWENMMYNEVSHRRPVLYSGGIGTGHEFILHGYRDGLFYVNWGWGGDSDGYFALTNLLGFSAGGHAYIGIQPKEKTDEDDSYSKEGIKVVDVKEAGTLSSLLSDMEKSELRELKLKGNLNGTDILLLRDMAGYQRSLNYLDLSEIRIVEGGQAYYNSFPTSLTTSNDEIGEKMFEDFFALKQLVLPASIKKIKPNSCGIPNLHFISIPSENDVYYSMDNAIYERESGKLIVGCLSTVIPEGVKCIGEYAFSSISLDAIKLPESLTTIEEHAFDNCYLTTLYIPCNVNYIGVQAFSRTGIQYVEVSKNNKIYDSRNSCNAIIETTTNKLVVGSSSSIIPNNVTSIGEYAFCGSDRLKTIEIPDNVVQIGNGAFSNNWGLKTIHVNWTEPLQGVKNAFVSLPSDIKLVVPDGLKNKYESSSDWSVFNNIIEKSEYSSTNRLTIDITTAGTLSGMIEEDKKYTIEELVISGKLNNNDISFLHDMAGYDENRGVYSNGKLRYLDLFDSQIVEDAISGTFENTLRSNAFAYTALEEIVLPKNLVCIQDDAFFGCKINSLIVPKTLTSIGHNILYYCPLICINVEEGNPKYDSRDDCSALIETATNTLVIGSASTVIPKSVTSIGNNAFSGRQALVSMPIHEGITTIGDAAFWADHGLTSINIPKSVVSIGTPGGSAPFAGCVNVSSITVDPENTVYDSRNNCNAIIETATNTLIQGSAMTMIPNSVTTISSSAFKFQQKLVSIEIPASITTIEKQAFESCPNLNTVISYIKKPFSINASVFNGIDDKATLYVPYGTKEDYATVSGWDVFEKVIEMEPDGDEYPHNAAGIAVADFGKYYVGLNGKIEVPVAIVNNGIEPITSLEYNITTGGEKVEGKLEVSPIAFKKTVVVKIPFDADGTIGEQVKTLSITKVNNQNNETIDNTASGALVTLAWKPNITPVVEEFTGTWNGWSTRGAVARNLLCKEYGNDIVTIAVHGGSADEPMILSDYDAISALSNNNYPSAVINRGSLLDPYYGNSNSAFGVNSEIEAIKLQYVPGDIKVDASWTNNHTAIDIKTTTTFVEDVAESPYQIGYILLEDGLKGTGNEWIQSNNYSESNITDENLKTLVEMPSKITDMKYDNVPVAVWEPMTGVAGTIPTTITHDVPMEYTFKADISGNTRIQNKNKLTVVVLLLDKTTGKIINAAKQSMAVQGDVTGSGTVDVQDATLVVNYILGNGSDEYDYNVADMNGDNEIDVFDVTAMINVILSSNNNAPSLRRSMEPNESVRLSADGNEVLMAVDNVSRFTSFQFDVKVPKGAELLGVDWNGKMDSHLLQFAKTGEDTYKVVALSMESTPLSELNDTLLKLHLSNKTVGEMTIDNILFVTPMGEAVRFASHPLDMTTGIQSVTHSQAGQIYDLSGQRLNMKREQLPKGVYIINNQKVVIK